jgi:hypothetical protein
MQHTLRANFTTQKPAIKLKKLSNLFLMIALLLAYPTTQLLPRFWGWEDGPLEWTQALILFIGFLIAFWYSHKDTCHRLAQFWYAQLPLWPILLGRETSWGAAFLPFKSFDMYKGPNLVSRSELWYGPLVYPVLGVLLLLIVYLIIKYRLYRLPLQLCCEHRFPVLPFLLAISAIIIASCVERHLLPIPGNRGQLLEEYLETVFYLGLIVTDLEIYLRLKKLPFGASMNSPKPQTN